MRKVLSFVLVLAMILGSVSMAFAASFSDTEGKDYEAAAGLLADLGVISGYKDGTFGGEQNITRAEFVTMIVNALGYSTTGVAATGFKDVPNDYWAAQAIKTAKELGITAGKTATMFAPKDNITNDEAIAMTIRALGYKADYLVGTYPTNYINMAMNLQVLDGVKTGSAASTRGNVAQLVYNTLEESVVAYFDKDGYPVYQADSEGRVMTLLSRLGSTPDANYSVIMGSETATVSIMDYQGAYAKLYRNSDDKVTGVYDVSSTFLTGKFNNDGDSATKFTLTDDTEYSLNIGANSYYASAAAVGVKKANYFYNGVVSTGGIAITSGTSFTIACKVSGVYITDIYSIMEWDGETFSADADVIADDYADATPTFFGYKLKLDKYKKVDETTFALLGADSLTAIPDDAVVTVYADKTADEYVRRVEVSTKTFTGKVSEITSADKYIVDGTKYDLDGDVETVPTKGQDGTFYLTYAGKIFDFDPAVTTAAYAVVVANDTPTGGTSAKKSAGQVELFLADGTQVVYAVNKNCTNGTAGQYVVSGAAWHTTYGGVITNGNLVTYKLNSNGELIEIKDAGDVNVNGSVSKAYVLTSGGGLVTDKTVIIRETISGTTKKYSIGTKAALLDAAITGTAVKGTDGKIKALFLTNSSSTEAAKFYVFNGWSEIDNADYDYKLTGFEGKNAVELLASATGYALGNVYSNVVLNADGGVSALGTAATAGVTDTAIVGTTKTAVSSDGKILTAANGNTYVLDDEVVVYVKLAGKTTYSLGSTTTLKGLTSGNCEHIALYEVRSTSNKTYNVVVVEKK